MQHKKKNNEIDEAHEIDVPRNKQTGCVENFEDSFFRDIVSVASAKAWESSEKHVNIKQLVDLPEHIVQEIVDFQVILSHTGKKDDAGRPIIGFSFSSKFRKIDIIRELELRGKRARAFKK